MPVAGQPIDVALYLSDDEGDSKSDDSVALIVEDKENENEKSSLPPRLLSKARSLSEAGGQSN